MTLGWLALALLLAIGCGNANAAETVDSTSRSDPGSLVLHKSDGTAISVPTKGPLVDSRALELVRAIEAFDKERGEKDVFAEVPDRTARKTANELATALRDEALDQLDLAYRVARRTSSAVDGQILASGFDAMRKLAELVSRPPVRQYVSTQITSAIAYAKVQFISMPDYNSGSRDWQGYTQGQPMKMGIYQFRLLRPDDRTPLCEKLEIMRDPMIAKLDPPSCP